MFLYDVGSNTATIICRTCAAAYNLACGSIVEIPSVLRLLVHGKRLHTRAVWVDITYMDSIAMTKASRVEQSTIIVQCRCTECYLVATIAIVVAYADVVVTIAIACAAARNLACSNWCVVCLGVAIGICHLISILFLRSVEPFCLQFLAVEVYCPCIRICVISS